MASLCLFEGTVVSEGRGTDKPFQQYGHPILSGEHSFTPKPNVGSKYPKLEGQICHGEAFFDDSIDALRAKKLDLSHIIQAHAQFKRQFFTVRTKMKFERIGKRILKCLKKLGRNI